MTKQRPDRQENCPTKDIPPFELPHASDTGYAAHTRPADRAPIEGTDRSGPVLTVSTPAC